MLCWALFCSCMTTRIVQLIKDSYDYMVYCISNGLNMVNVTINSQNNIFHSVFHIKTYIKAYNF